MAPARPWATTPTVAPRPQRTSTPARIAQLAVIAGIGPTVLARAADEPGVLVAGLAVAGSMAIADRRLHRWPAALAVAATLTAAAMPLAGATAAAWLGLGLVIARWAVLRLAPWASAPASGPDASSGALLLSLVAAWSARDGVDVRTAVPVALALALPSLVRIGGGALPRAADRFGRSVGHAIGAALFTLIGLVAVLIPWTLQRILRIDPLATQAGWRRRRRRPLRPSAPWATDALLAPTPLGPRIRSTAAVLTVLAAVVAFTSPGQAIRDRLTGTNDAVVDRFRKMLADDDLPALEHPAPAGLEPEWVPPGGLPAALDDSPWYDTAEFTSGQGTLRDAWSGWRPHNPYRHLDFASRWVNIQDAARTTWTPPPCDCTRLTVWMYGGSAALGLDQRDEHTIASELARRAWRDGIALDVSNRGSNGSLHWTEAHRFGLDLAVDPLPDLVLFYDGFNDAWASSLRTSDDLRFTIDPTLAGIWDQSGRRSDPPDPPPGGTYLGLPDDEVLSQAQLASRAVDRYDRARTISTALARSAGVPVRYFWQPTRYSRDLVEGEPHDDTERENSSRMNDQLMATFLAGDVEDLTDVLDGNTEPLFTDDVHHNEEGSRIIADAIYARIEDDLRQLVEERSQP